MGINRREIKLNLQKSDDYRPVKEDVREYDGSKKILNDLEYILRLTELNTLKLRNEILEFGMLENLNSFIECNTTNREEKILAFEKELFDISVGYSDEIIKLRIPALLPHRKSKPDILFYEALKYSLEKFIDENKVIHFHHQQEIKENAVIVFDHCYKSPYMVRDNDNVEVKGIIDLLCLYQFLPSDKGNYLSIFHEAHYNNEFHENSTEIRILTREQFRQQI